MIKDVISHIPMTDKALAIPMASAFYWLPYLQGMAAVAAAVALIAVAGLRILSAWYDFKAKRRAANANP